MTTWKITHAKYPGSFYVVKESSSLEDLLRTNVFRGKGLFWIRVFNKRIVLKLNECEIKRFT